MRLRQVVYAARDLDAKVAELRETLPLGQPYRDPGVEHFGLHNAVMAMGDTFVEVVSPFRDDAPAARFIARSGEGPYMIMFQVPDTQSARERASRAGARIVWQNDLPEISGTHIHPKDVPGAIVSVDTPRPAESWHWAGPEWSGTAPALLGPGGVTGATIAAPDPGATARRWAEVLGELPPGIEFIVGPEARVVSFQFG
jgi:glyoxalase-like protein